MRSPSRSSSRVSVIDSHTAGEPTRVVIDGGPDLGSGTLAQRKEIFRDQYDSFRSGLITEPRGSEVVVGALLCTPVNPQAAAGVIFFNDVGYLGMCGHGTIGLITTLAHLGRLESGIHLIETPVGNVYAELHADGSVSARNVASYCYRSNVTVEVPGYGSFSGDIAWSGNWFFLIADHGFDLDLANRFELVNATTAIRTALATSGVTGAGGELIDHVELFGAPRNPENSSRNFVLCPGVSFDRSPCGTGTAAKMACMHKAGKLKPGEVWRQEGILGTVFTGSVQEQDDYVIPTITGRAWITAESTFLFEDTDPFREGIPF